MGLLETFSIQYLNGKFPPWFHQICESVATFPLFKNGNMDSVRPVGVKHALIRLLHKEPVRQNRGVLIAKQEPEQLALSKAGGAKLVHSVRMLSEDRRDFVVVKLDMKNAHNEVARAATITALEKDPATRHLAWHAATIMAPATGLESGGKLWGQAEEGQSQGDPEASSFFCVSWHEDVKELNAVLSEAGAYFSLEGF